MAGIGGHIVTLLVEPGATSQQESYDCPPYPSIRIDQASARSRLAHGLLGGFSPTALEDIVGDGGRTMHQLADRYCGPT
jgi:hypothetical protein